MAPVIAPKQDFPDRQSPGGSKTISSSGSSSPSDTGLQQQTDGTRIQVSTGTLWRPAPMKDPELDLALDTIYKSTANLQASAVQAVDALQGSRMSTGAIPVKGSMKGVATGLSTLSNVVASVDSGATPTNMTLSATPSPNSPGTFDIYVFAPTSTGNNTPILAANAVLVRWHAWGT